MVKAVLAPGSAQGAGNLHIPSLVGRLIDSNS